MARLWVVGLIVGQNRDFVVLWAMWLLLQSQGRVSTAQSPLFCCFLASKWPKHRTRALAPGCPFGPIVGRHGLGSQRAWLGRGVKKYFLFFVVVRARAKPSKMERFWPISGVGAQGTAFGEQHPHGCTGMIVHGFTLQSYSSTPNIAR